MSIRKLLRIIYKKENGQSVVGLVILMAAIAAGAAFAIDTGEMYLTKIRLQNAADNAALAGARLLPDGGQAAAAACENAEANGVDRDHTEITVPYGEDDDEIMVVCSREFSPGFGRLLGMENREITARAVAKQDPPTWNGEAFPFVNLDDDYAEDCSIVIWEKTGPGDFESLWKTEYTAINLGAGDDHSAGYFRVYYEDGLTVTKGTVATIKQEIGYIYEQHRPGYVFSLRSDVINSGKYSSLKNKDVIDVDDLVLLQVTFDNYDSSAKNLFFTVNAVYDITSGEYPTEYLQDYTIVTSSLADD